MLTTLLQSCAFDVLMSLHWNLQPKQDLCFAQSHCLEHLLARNATGFDASPEYKIMTVLL